MPENPRVSSEKPAIPTLWLDTSAVIKLTKVEKGEKLSKIEVERLSKLAHFLKALVAAGKLLCPQADQEEEYAAERLDKDIQGQFAGLSLGVSLTHRQGIFDYQAQYGMKAKVEGAAEIKLPVSIYFHDDPVKALEEARKRDLIIYLPPIVEPEILARRAAAKDQVGQEWESIRQENLKKGRTFEDQLKDEWNGYANAMISMVKQFHEKLKAGTSDFWDFMGVQGYLFYKAYWKDLGGKPPDWDGVYQFFCSPYFHNLPITRIRCQLGADLITGQQPIQSGDPMDVDLLSVAIPVSHFVLTDRKMENRVKKLGIDKEWNAQVYSMSTIDALFEELGKL